MRRDRRGDARFARDTTRQLRDDRAVRATYVAGVRSVSGLRTQVAPYEVWEGGNNLHRNIIFRDAPKRTKTILPYSAIDGNARGRSAIAARSSGSK